MLGSLGRKRATDRKEDIMPFLCTQREALAITFGCWVWCLNQLPPTRVEKRKKEQLE